MNFKSKYKDVTSNEYTAFTEKANVQPTTGIASASATATLFASQIQKMNTMYKLPINSKPTLEVGELASVRITKFLKTLGDEITEGVEIQTALANYEYVESLYIDDEPIMSPIDLINTRIKLDNTKAELLTDLSDWFADIMVYCRSEAMKFGLPLETIQSIIMASNYSKLNSDGSATYNEDGKVLKGPNFQPPEKYIKHVIID